jgi:hypothetical protein
MEPGPARVQDAFLWTAVPAILNSLICVFVVPSRVALSGDL